MSAPVQPDPGPAPALPDCVGYVRALGKPTVAQVLDAARATGRVAIQPRCGVGGHAEMLTLLRELATGGAPDILTVTIDSHTRLLRFDRALRVLNVDPAGLNGYPLVAHGWRRGRELTEAVAAPIEIRHGSPDGRALFAVSIASGATSYEGGGISYNLPYAKDVPLATSLAAWREVDAACGELARLGLVVDRELFGTLSAVLVPPSVSLAISVLEAVAAAAEGVRCVSIAYPQGGNVLQDVAALRAIPVLTARYLPAEVTAHAVLHEFMGVFPVERAAAEQLILYGALVARLGGASKVVTKTHEEARGVPGAPANVNGLRLANLVNTPLLDFVTVDEDRVAEEREWILDEVAELLAPVLDRGDFATAVVDAFAAGRLDIPFSASRHARSDVIPRRDAEGAIRYWSAGELALSARSRRRNTGRLAATAHTPAGAPAVAMAGLLADVNYFADQSAANRYAQVAGTGGIR